MIESVILCEGYHDRAFWAEWLLTFGCTDPGIAQDSSRITVYDPFGRPVTGGQFAFHSKSSAFLRIQPCNGKATVLRSLTLRLKQHATMPASSIVVNIDSDLNADGSAGDAPQITLQGVEVAIKSSGLTVQSHGANAFVADGTVLVSLIRWTADDPPTDGVPNQQSLERLVCASVDGAYPGRGMAVQQWLKSRVNAPPSNPKEHAWSFMAGWYSEHGCDDFYRQVWRDPLIAAQLEKRLRSSGAWQMVEHLAT